jgi:antibiotic biosynthesis monooxygenase (ABM) superfamily enzyme
MVLYVLKYDVHPDKSDAFAQWAPAAIRRSLAVPGVVEFRSYRGAAGVAQVISTWEFADLAAWAAWHSSEEVRKLASEVYTIGIGVTLELWGPSPVAPAPIRPGK